jgi:hypothetical protein
MISVAVGLLILDEDRKLWTLLLMMGRIVASWGHTDSGIVMYLRCKPRGAWDYRAELAKLLYNMHRRNHKHSTCIGVESGVISAMVREVISWCRRALSASPGAYRTCKARLLLSTDSCSPTSDSRWIQEVMDAVTMILWGIKASLCHTTDFCIGSWTVNH